MKRIPSFFRSSRLITAFVLPTLAHTTHAARIFTLIAENNWSHPELFRRRPVLFGDIGQLP